MSLRTTTATLENIADANVRPSAELALVALTEGDLASVVGGDSPALMGGDNGSRVQCVDRVSDGKQVCSVY